MAVNGPLPRLDAIERLADVAAARLGPNPAPAPSRAELDRLMAGAGYAAALANASIRSAGGGGALTLVLFRAMLVEALHRIAAGVDRQALSAELSAALSHVWKALLDQGNPVKDLEAEVAIVSTTAQVEPALARLVVQAMKRVGRYGSITVGAPSDFESHIEQPLGLSWTGGLASPYFATDPRIGEAMLRDPLLLLVDGQVDATAPLAVSLRLAAAAGRPLLVAATKLEPEALAVLVLNHLAGAARVCAVKLGVFGDHARGRLVDLALLTGGRVLTPESLDAVSPADLGQAAEVRAGELIAAVIDGAGDEARVASHVEALERAAHDALMKDDDLSHGHLLDRQIRLAQGVAVIRLGAELRVGPDDLAAAIAAAQALDRGRAIPPATALAAVAGTLGSGPGAEVAKAALAVPARCGAGEGALEPVDTVSQAVAAAADGVRLLLGEPEFMTPTLQALAARPLALLQPPRHPAPGTPQLRPLASAATAAGVRVVLKDCGEMKISVIKELLAMRPDLSLASAKVLVETTPQTVASGVTAQQAESIRLRLASLGAQVEVGVGVGPME